MYKDMAAICILNEMEDFVNVYVPDDRLISLHSRASLFLKRHVTIDLLNQKHVHLLLETLRVGPSEQGSFGTIDDALLTEQLKTIMAPFVDEKMQTDIGILCKMHCVRSLFQPWIKISIEKQTRPIDLILHSLNHCVSDANSSLRSFFVNMLSVSCLLHRVEILERHSLVEHLHKVSDISDKYTKTILSAIYDSIDAIERSLPRSYYKKYMVEYSSLWSKVFHHATVGKLWECSFKAVMNHPSQETKQEEFRKLVLAMADNGELNHLLELIPFTVVNASVTSDGDKSTEIGEANAIDLYELASDALAAAAYQASYHFMDTTQSVLVQTNYSGCLYAIHASQENWRRCAQSMDYGGLIIMNALFERTNIDEPLERTVIQTNFHDKAIVENLTLSAVASSQLIQLTPSPSERFIVRGEIGPYPVPALLRHIYSSFSSINTSTELNSYEEGNIPPMALLMKADLSSKCSIRSSLLQTDTSLRMQASKMIAIRRIFMDSLSKFTAADVIFMPPIHIMLYLAQFGYHADYVSMAVTREKMNIGSRPRGRELLADAVTYIIHDHLAPIAVRSSCISSNDDTKNEDTTSLIPSRPSIYQLLQCSGGHVTISDGWRSYKQSVDLIRADSAMELIRTYTERYSSADNSLAIEVAQTLLELENGQAALPSWLITLILGPAKDRGLFASTGNPSALILAYIRWDMLVEAAVVVSTVLSGNGFDRKRTATSRLPEKGNIDYVPYKVIDLLWDLLGQEIADPSMDENSKDRLLHARVCIESALTNHFHLMKISEAGIHSARVLKAS
jgi:hypothetical protein